MQNLSKFFLSQNCNPNCLVNDYSKTILNANKFGFYIYISKCSFAIYKSLNHTSFKWILNRLFFELFKNKLFYSIYPIIKFIILKRKALQTSLSIIYAIWIIFVFTIFIIKISVLLYKNLLCWKREEQAVLR